MTSGHPGRMQMNLGTGNRISETHHLCHMFAFPSYQVASKAIN
jgi:hypothetical protein